MASNLKVAKFGGSSLADAVMIKKVCNIITSDPARRLIVVSAPGKRDKADIKVTDMLIACADAMLKTGNSDKELELLVARFAQIVKDLQMPSDIVAMIEKDLQTRLAADTSDQGAFMDSLKAAGEDNCAKLIAAYLQSQGVDAAYVDPKDVGMILSDEPGNAQVLVESYAKLKQSLSGRKGIVIFPGFFGYTKQNKLVTFPRGGSDITGAILAAAACADLYENFTDVDSVFAANPNIIDSPAAIDGLTYREMRELSYAGFGVFHAEALAPVVKAQIPICIKNTNNPLAVGTLISQTRKLGSNPAAGIASGTGFCSINLSKYMMNRELGFGRRLLQILEEEGLSYEHAPSGIDDISVLLDQQQLSASKQSHVLARIKQELQVDEVTIEKDMALIMVVGEAMRHHVGTAVRATKSFAIAGVNLEMINQGASEVSMMFGIKACDTDDAVKGLYEEFFG